MLQIGDLIAFPNMKPYYTKKRLMDWSNTDEIPC